MSVVAQPRIDRVTNNYSFFPPDNPDYGIAQGSIFTIFGSNLSNARTPLQKVPLPNTLEGVSGRVTVNGTRTDMIWYYVSPNQLGGILPSNTPVGRGTITVTNNGQTSAAAEIVVVRSAFGTLTRNGAGTGAAAVYDLNYDLLSPANSARPGEIIALFGTGAGPVSGSETVQQAPSDLSAVPIVVEIGGIPATVLYHGRTTFPGLDQVNVIVPESVKVGCNISVVVKSSQRSSNLTTIPIASDGGTCPASADPCALNHIRRGLQGGLQALSPDGTRYLLNKDDENGIGQIYVGQRDGGPAVCISCKDQPSGPKANKRKMQPRWHPSGRWIVLAVEQENYERPILATPDIIEGLLESGIWVDMWAVTPDGASWFKLQDFGPSHPADGFTGVAFTPDGTQGVWAQIVDGNLFAYTFGKWELIIGDFREVNGVASFTNLRNITPTDTFWLEPGTFSPNGRDLLLSADQGFPDHAKVYGQDQFILDVVSGKMTNLTKSPNIWDEHGVFSPDGEKILFMSSYPYRSEPLASTVLFLKTEFMIMDKDGSNMRQLTRFNEPGFTESNRNGTTVAAVGGWSADGSMLSVINLVFPKYEHWEIQFEGNCGSRGR